MADSELNVPVGVGSRSYRHKMNVKFKSWRNETLNAQLVQNSFKGLIIIKKSGRCALPPHHYSCSPSILVTPVLEVDDNVGEKSRCEHGPQGTLMT